MSHTKISEKIVYLFGFRCRSK